jgi:hypothetical protein
MRELQMALPGVSSQQASAFVCQYQVEGGVGTAAVFHLHKSEVLAFYFCDPRVVPEEKAEKVLGQSLNFVESMGFLMTDQDIHLLGVPDQELLWASLPIQTGLPAENESPSATAAKRYTEKPAANVQAVQQENQEATASLASVLAVKEEPVLTSGKADPKVEPIQAVSENVDDLLAAIEAMRANGPGLRASKPAPSAEEIAHRRLQLHETVGRILASL